MDIDSPVDPLTKAIDNFDNCLDMALDKKRKLPARKHWAGDTPYTFPDWYAMPHIKAEWAAFKAQEDLYDQDHADENTIRQGQIEALNKIREHLGCIIPDGTRVPEGLLRDFCALFEEVLQFYGTQYNCSERFPSIMRRAHRPVTWKAISIESSSRKQDETIAASSSSSSRFSVPKLSGISSSLNTLEALTNLSEIWGSGIAASVARELHEDSRLHGGSSDTVDAAWKELKLASEALRNLLADTTFLNHATPIGKSLGDIGQRLKELQSPIDAVLPENHTELWTEQVRKSFVRLQMRELEGIRDILKVLLPLNGTITAGDLQVLCLAYDKVALLMTMLYGEKGACELLLLDRNRPNTYDEYPDRVSWEPLSEETASGVSSHLPSQALESMDLSGNQSTVNRSTQAGSGVSHNAS